MVLGLLGSASFGFGFMTAVAKEIPRLDPSRQGAREENSYILNFEGDRNLAVLRGGENRVIVTSDDIASVMKQAIVAVEDRRFFDHRGVDARAIARAFWADVREPERRPGGIDDHAAVRQERLREEPALDRPQAPRGGARVAARAAVVEGQDPDRVPEHDLLRERRVRDRAGLARVLRALGQAPDAPRGGSARRDPRRPDPLRPEDEPPRRLRPARAGAFDDGRPGRDQPRGLCGRSRCSATQARDHPAARLARRRRGAVLRQLRQAAARGQVRRAGGLRRRAQGEDDDRPRACRSWRGSRSRSGSPTSARRRHSSRCSRRAAA